MANGYTSRNGETGEVKLIIIFSDGTVGSIPGTHQRFEEIHTLIQERADDEVVRDLINSQERDLNARLVELTDRISVQNGTLLVDGHPAHDAITDHILRMLEEGDNDYLRVVLFYESLSKNPSRRSREQLFSWLQSTGMFQLADNGHILGYKGVNADGNSIHAGGATVDGQWVDGRVPYRVGSVVSLERSQVQDDPNIACSYGLHVGTLDYAQGYGVRILKVSFAPEDVVSVPSHDTRKLRTCKLRVESEEANPRPSRSTRFESNYDDANDVKLDDDSQDW